MPSFTPPSQKGSLLMLVRENERKTHMVRYGLVVRIPGSHPGGPGSIPGNGNPILPIADKKLRRGWDSNPRGQSPLD